MPKPSRIPSTAPRAVFLVTLGDEGDVGIEAVAAICTVPDGRSASVASDCARSWRAIPCAPSRALGERSANWLLTVDSADMRSEEHTSELQSLRHLVCRLLL